MTAADKKRKVNSAVQSTDRGGVLFLPLGVAFIGLGFMMLLGTILQTAASSLEFFKSMAIGLGGGLYPLIPFFSIWLGSLLCITSKRHISLYSYLISFLLLLCAGAFFTLVIPISQSLGNASVMTYLNNQINTSLRPKGMGEYLGIAYSLKKYVSNSASILPGGGVLGMLLAYPLWSFLGDIGSVVVLIIVFISLLFAMVRMNPFKLREHIGKRTSAQPEKSRVPVEGNAVVQKGPSPAQPAQVYPDDTPLMNQDYQNQPAFTQPDFASEVSYAPSAPEEGPFIAQTPAMLWMDPNQPDFSPQPSVQPRQQADISLQSTQPARKPGNAPINQNGSAIKNQVAADQVVGGFSAVRQNELVPERKPFTEPSLTTPQSKPVLQTPQIQAQDALAPRVTTANKEKISIVNTAMAVPLSGERVPIAERKQLPDKVRALDGTVIKPVPQQIRLAIDDYAQPPIRLLTEQISTGHADTTAEDRIRADKLIETLNSFSITASLHDITHGPTVTRFAIRLAEGVNVSRLRSVMDNLTIEMKAKGDIRAEIPIPGTSFVGLEVSNDKTSTVFLSEVLGSSRLQESRSPTCVALGKDITGAPITCELMDMPHLLIAGATGSGKSVCINSIICSILYRASPKHVRLILIDPKFVELQPYNDVPHLLLPVITDAKKATAALDWVCQEMDRRYQVLQEAGVRNLDAYNRKLSPDEDPIPRIILIVDEMGDLMTTSGKLIEDHIKRITAKARAAGICLILATQRPSVNVITGVIKANIPGRIAFRVSSPFDSKTILDMQGAEKLLGYGDMLYRSTTREPIRVQGCFVSDHDVEQTVEYIKSRNKAEYNLDLIEHIEQDGQTDNMASTDSNDTSDSEFDELLPQAIEMAVESGQMSISMLQRVLRVGYARSGRLIDEMARRGIISGNEGTKARKTLMNREQYSTYLEQGY